jgi:hypothetical protein
VKAAARILAKMRPREELKRRAEEEPGFSFHTKQLRRHDYYSSLAGSELTSLDHMSVALRWVEPDKRMAHFRLVYDNLLPNGFFVRMTADVGRTDPVWRRPNVSADRQTRRFAESIRPTVKKLAAVDAELAYARLATKEDLSVEQVIKGGVGPFYFRFLRTPNSIRRLFEKEGDFIASFSLDMAVSEIAVDTNNDPLQRLLGKSRTDAERKLCRKVRSKHSFRVFKDRKLLVPEHLVNPVFEYCKSNGTKNIIQVVKVDTSR